MSTPAVAPTVAVVGAGLIGAAVAFTLRRAGYAVTVFDADLPGAAWRAGAGLLTPSGEALHAGPLAELAGASLRLWPEFARDLEAASGVPVHFREGLERVGPGGGRVRTPGEGQVYPPGVVRAALRGVEVRRERVGGLSAGGGGVNLHGKTATSPASLVVLAAGAWSASFGLPVFAVQGQALVLGARHDRPALFGGRRRGAGATGYTLCRPDGVYVGATVRRSTSPHPDAHARRWLLATAHRLVPEAAHAPVTGTLVGLRPYTPSGLPLVGRHPTLPGVLVATGHGRHGALLAPWTAQEVLRLVRESAAVEVAG